MRRPLIPVAMGTSAGILAGSEVKNPIILISICIVVLLAMLPLVNRLKGRKTTKPLEKATNKNEKYIKNIKETKIKNNQPMIGDKYTKGVMLFIIFASIGVISVWNVDINMAKSFIPLGNVEALEGEILTVKEKDGKQLKMEIKTQEGKILVNYYKKGNFQEDKQVPKEDNKTEKENNISRIQGFEGNLVGRKIKVAGTVEEPPGRRNPKCFDYAGYLKTQGIVQVLTAKKIQIGEVARPIRYYASSITKRFSQGLKNNLDKERAQMVSAMLFGSQMGMEEDLYEKFQLNGTAHLLAASGLHVGMVYGLFVLFFGKKTKVYINLLIGAALIFYAAMACFSPSVVRAVSMIILHIYSQERHKRYDLISAGALTFTIMALWNPYNIFNLGFQMSFLAILTLGVFIPFLRNQPKKDLDYKKAVFPLVSIQLVMAPFTAYTFNYLSFMALLANIPMIFMAGLLIPLGIISVIATSIIPETMPFMATILEIVGSIMLECNDFFYGRGNGYIEAVSPPIFFVIAFYLILFYLASEHGRVLLHRKEIKKISLAIILIFAIAGSISLYKLDEFKDKALVFLDVGQGNCLFVRTPEGKNLLFDGGGKTDFDVGKKILKPYLLKNGIKKIDKAFVSHLDTDHYGGILSLYKSGNVDKMVFHASCKGQVPMGSEFLQRGDIVMREKNFYIEVVGPIIVGEDINENSLVLKIHYGNLSILASGDISAKTEKLLVDAYSSDGEKNNILKSDILIAPHHGSKYSSSSEFLDKVDPAVVVIQVGKNKYGHPAAAVIERYSKNGIIIYRNDIGGAIGIGGGNYGEIIQQVQ